MGCPFRKINEMNDTLHHQLMDGTDATKWYEIHNKKIHNHSRSLNRFILPWSHLYAPHITVWNHDNYCHPLLFAFPIRCLLFYNISAQLQLNYSWFSLLLRTALMLFKGRKETLKKQENQMSCVWKITQHFHHFVSLITLSLKTERKHNESQFYFFERINK